jgi:hypothetical protein
MASVLRVDQLQTSNGTPLLSSDGTGMLSIDSRFKLPQFTTETLPTTGSLGEVVFDITDSIAKFWDGDKWQDIGVKKITSSIVGIHWQSWSSTFQSSAVQTYQEIPGSVFSFQTKESGSSFILMSDLCGYQASSSSGVNMAYRFNGVQYAGQSGSPGDTWMGSLHSGTATGSFNLKKIWVVSPNLSAGSTVTASCMFGHWSGTSSNHYVNYPGYSPVSEFVILEFKNT